MIALLATIARGEIAREIADILSLDQARRAHERIAAGEAGGRLVLDPWL